MVAVYYCTDVSVVSCIRLPFRRLTHCLIFHLKHIAYHDGHIFQLVPEDILGQLKREFRCRKDFCERVQWTCQRIRIDCLSFVIQAGQLRTRFRRPFRLWSSLALRSLLLFNRVASRWLVCITGVTSFSLIAYFPFSAHHSVHLFSPISPVVGRILGQQLVSDQTMYNCSHKHSHQRKSGDMHKQRPMHTQTMRRGER